MERGHTVINQHEEWCSAFGVDHRIPIGERLTITGTRFVAGSKFLEFEGIPDSWFWASGFKSLRGLN